MKLSNLPVWLLLASSAVVDASLRGGTVNINGRQLHPPSSIECVIHAVALLEVEPGSMDNDLEFECEMEHNGRANQAFRIVFDNTQARAFKDMLDEGGDSGMLFGQEITLCCSIPPE